MDSEFELEEALERLLRSHLRAFITIDGVVDEINNDNTCDVIVGSTTFNSVPLRVLIGSQASVYEVPVIGSKCLLNFRDGNINRPQIVQVDQVDQLLINCASLVQYNDGELGGMVKALELKAQSEKDKAILDGLLQVINGPPIMEPGNGSPSALQIALQSVLSSLQSGTWNDLEDPKITH